MDGGTLRYCTKPSDLVDSRIFSEERLIIAYGNRDYGMYESQLLPRRCQSNKYSRLKTVESNICYNFFMQNGT